MDYLRPRENVSAWCKDNKIYTLYQGSFKLFQHNPEYVTLPQLRWILVLTGGLESVEFVISSKSTRT